MIRLDTETYSATPIKWGTYRYASDCEVMTVQYALDDEEVSVWDRTQDKRMPEYLEYLIHDTDEPITAHNAMFDRNALRLGDMKLEIPIERWRCSMVRALAHALPGGLDALCEIMNVNQDLRKLKEGKKLIHLFCKPRPANSKIERATYLTHPKEWAQFLEYARMDIVAMRALDKMLPRWNYDPDAKPGDTHVGAQELALWHLDQKINDRGIYVDTDLANAAVRAVEAAKKRLAKRTQDITDNEVESTTKRDQLLAHILIEHGVELPDMQMSTLERRLNDPDLPREVRELIAIRLQASSTSTSKYAALLKGVMPDNRLRGTLQFNGAARTRRHAGRMFQPQNLPSKGLPNYREVDAGIDAMKGGYEDILYA